MPPVAFTLALAAAVLHAFWNLLLARARDTESATAVALLAAVIVFAPVTVLRFDAEWAVWPFIVVTSLLQLLYFALLATAYRKAELSFVYPVARGVAPAIVLVVSVLVLGHATSAAQVAGVLLVGAGVLLVRGLKKPPDPARALVRARDRRCDRLVHAARQARHHSREPDHLPRAEHDPAALGYALARRSLVKGQDGHEQRAQHRGVLAGLRVIRRVCPRPRRARARVRRVGGSGARDQCRDSNRLRGARAA